MIERYFSASESNFHQALVQWCKLIWRNVVETDISAVFGLF